MITPQKKRVGVFKGSRPYTPLFVILLALILLCFFVGPVKAQGDALNLTDWDTNMSQALGYDDSGFVGGMILSGIFTMLLVLPIAMISRSKYKNSTIYPELAVTILSLVICVGIGWLHYWILLVTALLIALLFAYSMKGLIGGGS